MNITEKKLYYTIILTAILTASCNSKKKHGEETLVDNKRIFSIPFPNLRVKDTTYHISNASDTILYYNTGSKIFIPKNAFIDREGHPVKHSVKLTYKEFINVLDIYLEGIPMVYDSSGKEQVFETAGMIKVIASSNGQPVFPNPNRKIQVQMTSFHKGNDYNVYQLDTITGEWNYIEKNEVKIDDYDKRIASLPQIPSLPKKAGPFSFSIGDETGNYPELDIFQNVLFEPIDNKYCGLNATEIKVKDLGNGVYDVIFIMDVYGTYKEQTCKCRIAFNEGIDYENALKVYYNTYKKLIRKREKLKREIDTEWKNYQVAVKKNKIDVFNFEFASLTENQRILRTLQINEFGFVNCDRPEIYPQGAELIAKFKDPNGNELILNNIVLVEKGRNALFRYTSEIKFNPKKENLLWGITSNNKLAYMKPNDFKKINARSGAYTFVMNVHQGGLNKYEDIYDILF